MKKTKQGLLMGLIGAGIFLSHSAAGFTLSVPPRGDIQTSRLGGENPEALKEADRQLQRIIAEMNRVPGDCGTCIAEIKRDLEKVELKLRSGAEISAQKDKPEKWIPPRVAWALDLDSR